MDPFHATVFKGFDADGEDAVRNNLALGNYNTKHGALAREWLRRQEAARRDAADAENTEIARSAKNAAWDAVEEARAANKWAKWAFLASIVAILVSIVAIYLGVY